MQLRSQLLFNRDVHIFSLHDTHTYSGRIYNGVQGLGFGFALLYGWKN